MSPKSDKKKVKTSPSATYKKNTDQQRRIPIDNDAYSKVIASEMLKTMTESKDNVMDSVEETIPKKKKRRMEQEEEEEKQVDFMDEDNLNIVKNNMTNIAIIESNSTDVSEQTIKRNITNPYRAKRNVTRNNESTNENTGSPSIASVPEVVNVARNNNFISPCSFNSNISPTKLNYFGIQPAPSASMLGIIPVPSPKIISPVLKAKARIRCAYINGVSQTVVFWLEELTLNAYWAQITLVTLIREEPSVKASIPFELPESNKEIFKLHRNNIKVDGKEKRNFGYTLFHYKNLTIQNCTELIKIANIVCNFLLDMKLKQEVIIDEKNLFYFKESCVWSNLTNTQTCLYLLKIETGDYVLNNEDNLLNPRYWENHKAIIAKYFFPNKLNVELAIKFNAPIDQIDDVYEKTTAIIALMEKRRKLIDGVEEIVVSDDEIQDDLDPKTQFNYDIKPIQTNVARSANNTTIHERTSPCDEDIMEFIQAEVDKDNDIQAEVDKDSDNLKGVNTSCVVGENSEQLQNDNEVLDTKMGNLKDG